MTTATKPLALVLGATGGIGGATARALAARGWQVRALARDLARVDRALPVDWVQGDALQAAEVTAAAAGARVIVHAVNPPGYRNWAGLVLPMLRATLAAGRAHGARIVLPGTVYNYAADGPELVAEDAPQATTTRKGRLRIEMEAALEASGLKVLIVRAGDFFGPHSANSWFGQVVVPAGRPLAAITDPGRPGVGHAWAYLPDVAETIARLLGREGELARFERFHMAGHWFADGADLAAAIRAAAGRPDLPLKRFPWPLVRLAAPVVPLFRELSEMRYLWRRPLRLDNRKLVAFLGAEPHTPAVTALRASLAGLGCLPDAAAMPVPAH
ncbi:nucleoside-diphosphate-sugar epimerase [Zavarzinia compransoris]|uniref:NAD(P)-binding domain-containing protein n=2 Tax=Zavarzinia compransoris TaxID=1264899 RepID=A0A317DXM5_9PROT|nr:hypothetical protein DKG75_18765 [Zavarzinia compransoris]TDP49013.1 nucleoside-diphosphate-sugar epimerase [Zavarzinia compransoris]